MQIATDNYRKNPASAPWDGRPAGRGVKPTRVTENYKKFKYKSIAEKALRV